MNEEIQNNNLEQSQENNISVKDTPAIWFKTRFPDVASKHGKAIDVAFNDERCIVKGINEDFLADIIGHVGNPKSPTVYMTCEDRFFRYEPEIGIFVSVSENQIIKELSSLLQKCAADCQQVGFCDTSALHFYYSKASQLAGVIKKAKGLLHVSEGYFDTDVENFLACKNGILRLADMELLPFDANYRRRNKLAVSYDPNATCPQFIDILMKQALNDDDIEFLQKWFALALLGKNISQVIVILSGTAQGGKSTFAKILMGVIGKENVATLRTDQLGQRFETASFLGKTLLHGVDVPADFLTQKSACALKYLTGGDSTTVELKNGRERPEIVGQFNVLITCNSRLVIRLEGDAEAWRRRLAIIVYCKPKPQNVIPDLADTILRDEGAGVLIWALEGFKKHRAANWRFKLTDLQADIVDRALLESDSPKIFAKERIIEEEGATLTQDDCFGHYVEFCRGKEWTPMQKPKANQIIESQIMCLFAVSQRNDIKGSNGKDQRGWKGIKINS